MRHSAFYVLFAWNRLIKFSETLEVSWLLSWMCDFALKKHRSRSKLKDHAISRCLLSVTELNTLCCWLKMGQSRFKISFAFWRVFLFNVKFNVLFKSNHEQLKARTWVLFYSFCFDSFFFGDWILHSLDCWQKARHVEKGVKIGRASCRERV